MCATGARPSINGASRVVANCESKGACRRQFIALLLRARPVGGPGVRVFQPRPAAVATYAPRLPRRRPRPNRSGPYRPPAFPTHEQLHQPGEERSQRRVQLVVTSSVGAATSTKVGLQSPRPRYTPSRSRQCTWIPRLAAEPDRWISVAAPPMPAPPACPLRSSRWRVTTRRTTCSTSVTR